MKYMTVGALWIVFVAVLPACGKEDEGGIASIAPGMRVFFEANVTQGEYVVVCMTTAPDGRAHIEHGMIQQISVR